MTDLTLLPPSPAPYPMVRGAKGDVAMSPEERAERFDVVCDLIGTGSTRSEACLQAGISTQMLQRWLSDNSDGDTWHRWVAARLEQAHALADEALDLVRAQSRTLVEAQDKRTAVDYLKWRATKLNPRTYGDKTTTEITGPDGGPLQVAAAMWMFGDRKVSF